MDRGNTKQEILEASLDLFSVQGFEATSISQIANAVGIRKASLYSHFENKQAILDALVKEVLEQYAAHSIFARTDWGKDTDNRLLTQTNAKTTTRAKKVAAATDKKDEKPALPLLQLPPLLRIRNNGRAACNAAGNRANAPLVCSTW